MVCEEFMLGNQDFSEHDDVADGDNIHENPWFYYNLCMNTLLFLEKFVTSNENPPAKLIIPYNMTRGIATLNENPYTKLMIMKGLEFRSACNFGSEHLGFINY
jgi:hypothetical protein